MENDILYTIKELYEWAVKNGYENYEVYTSEGNIYIEDICINKKHKEIAL